MTFTCAADAMLVGQLRATEQKPHALCHCACWEMWNDQGLELCDCAAAPQREGNSPPSQKLSEDLPHRR